MSWPTMYTMYIWKCPVSLQKKVKKNLKTLINLKRPQAQVKFAMKCQDYKAKTNSVSILDIYWTLDIRQIS